MHLTYFSYNHILYILITLPFIVNYIILETEVKLAQICIWPMRTSVHRHPREKVGTASQSVLRGNGEYLPVNLTGLLSGHQL